MKRKALVFMVILIMAASGLWAAAGRQTGTGSSGPVTLEFWTWLDEENYMTEVVKTYNALHPEVNVRLTVSPDWNQKLAIALSGGATIDAFCTGTPSDTAPYVEMGQVEKLDSYISASKMDVSGISGFIDSFKSEHGAVYCLPYRKSVWVLFYNKKVFDDAGIPYPGDNLTWEEYTELGKRLTKGSGDSKVYGILNFQPTSHWWRIPANTTSANNPVLAKDLAEYKKAAKLAWDYSYTYGIQPDYADRVGTAAGDYAGIFMQGNYGMMMNGDWAVNMLNTGIEKGANLDYDVAAIPHWAGKEAYSTGIPTVTSIPTASKHKDEIFKFISYLASNDGAKIISRFGMLPAWSSKDIQDIYLQGLAHPKHGEVFFTQKVYSQSPASSQYNRAQAIVAEEVSLYLLRERDLDATFTTIEQRIKDEVLNTR
jgi:multiple sugar transport system substrate-binding protein